MKSAVFLLSTLLAMLAAPSWAQTPAEMTAERARITAERSRVETAFAQEEKACYAKFAVSGCIQDARAIRRGALADLRRQEIGLNDIERKQKATERLRELEAREAEQRARPPNEARVRGQAEPKEGVAPAPGGATKTERAPSSPQKKAPQAAREPKVPAAPDTATNLRRHQERVEQAAEHKAKVIKRAAQENKAAKPLPVPP